MARILFCALSNDGFLQPLAAIAERLQGQGHDVRFVASLYDELKLSARGLIRIPRGTSDGPSFDMKTWSHPYSIAMQVKHLSYGMKLFEPDVIVSHQLSMAPVVLRSILEVPLCVLGIAAYIWPGSSSTLSDGPRSVRDERVLWQHDDLLRILNRALDTISLKPVQVPNFRSTPFVGDRFLLQSVPELCPDLDALPEQVTFVGSCVASLPEANLELAGWLSRGDERPLVYVQGSRSFGNQNFWPPVLRALAQLNVRVVASVGRLDCDQPPAPERFFVRDSVAQELVLSQASLFIGGGHTTGTLGAVTAGVPCLLFPAGSGTIDISERFEKAGAARALSVDSCTEDQLAATISEMLANVAYRRAAEFVAALFARRDAIGLCAQSILDLQAVRSEPVAVP